MEGQHGRTTWKDNMEGECLKQNVLTEPCKTRQVHNGVTITWDRCYDF
jgi:hypothetical protein